MDLISTCFSWDSGSRRPPDPLVVLAVTPGDRDAFRMGGCVVGLVAGDAFIGGVLRGKLWVLVTPDAFAIDGCVFAAGCDTSGCEASGFDAASCDALGCDVPVCAKLPGSTTSAAEYTRFLFLL